MTAPLLHIAIIGCGRVAAHHAARITDIAGTHLVAVCDLVKEKASAFAADFGVPWFTDYRAMFQAHPEIKVVAVVTPSGMHFEHTMEILERWGKHVIVEKPTFMRPEHAEQAFDTAERLGLKLFPVFQNRYNKAVRRVKKALTDGELGDIRVVNVRLRWCRPQRYYDLAPWRGTFSHDGGALTNQTIHHVDLLRHLGGDVAQVNATMRTLGAEIEVEDTTVATLAYDSGAIGSLESTTAARPDDFEASISFIGSEGLAQIGGVAVNELQIFTPDPESCASYSEDFHGIKGAGAVYGHGHEQMYHDIVADFAGTRPYPVDREDCLATLRLLHAFYVSDETGGWATLSEEKQSERLGRANEAIADLYRIPETGGK